MITDPTSKRFELMRLRLSEGTPWFPFPGFIGVGIAIIIFSKVLLNINPRIGSPAALHESTSSEEFIGALWFAVSIKDSKVIIYTDDKEVFQWSAENPESGDYKDFKEYLNSRSQEKLSDIARSRRVTVNETRVVIAPDRNTSWYHLHPVITALSQNGFDTYGFETKVIAGGKS